MVVLKFSSLLFFPCILEAKNEWSHPPLHLYAFMTYRDIYTFTFTVVTQWLNCFKNRLPRPGLYFTHGSTVREVAVHARRSPFSEHRNMQSPRESLDSQGVNKIRMLKMPYDLAD
jgi:hypothetical protein